MSDDDVCPVCGGPTIPIVYGYPGPDLVEASERGEVALGGCMVWDGRPKRRCPRCAARRAETGAQTETPF